jgi:hypothetical protein
MGSRQSLPDVPDCDIGPRKLPNNEFQLALDAKAFEFHMLAGVKALRVSELALDGYWKMSREDVYTKSKPFLNKYIQIEPGMMSKDGTGTLKEAKLTILEEGVFYLYKSTRSSILPILCRNGPGSSVLYINMILRRQELKKGHYSSVDEDMILLTPESILIVNLPDDTTKPTFNFLAEKAFDPTLLSFASRPLVE